MTTKVTPSVLNDTSVTTGTYGGSTQHAVFTVDQQGRLTGAANATPSIATSQLTGTINATQVANTQVYGINITGSAGSATNATYATSAGSATNATYATSAGSATNASAATNAGNATTAGGLAVASGRNNQSNQIVRTNSSGYLDVGYVNSDTGNENNASNPPRVWGTNGSDNYMRTYQVGSLSVGSATNAGYATSAGSATNASAATNATYATSAGSATNAGYATSAGNGGVTSIVAGNGISISGGTGAVTINQDFYTGSSGANISYPVGSYLGSFFDSCESAPTLNTTVGTRYTYTSAYILSYAPYTGNPGAATVAGSWKTRGAYGNYLLVQRVS